MFRIVILFVLITTISVLSVWFWRSNSSDSLRAFVQILLPSKNRYNYIINEAVDVTKTFSTKRFVFKNRYSGRYDLGILLEKSDADLYFKLLELRRALELRMRLDFYREGSLILSRTLGQTYDPFIARQGNTGFSFMTYEAPKDFPLNQAILCELKIVVPDIQLAEDYGPVRFYIQKMSDK